MNIIAIDIGNTKITVAFFLDDKEDFIESVAAGLPGGKDKLTKLTVSNVQMGIHLHYMYSVMDNVPLYRAYPDSLDGAPPYSQCGAGNPFFIEVLDEPGLRDDKWLKGETIHHYIAPNGSTYVYIPSKGEFHQ